MKPSGQCPKCESVDLIRVPGRVGAGDNIATGVTVFSAVKISRHICGRCGYVESWVDDLEDLAKLKEKFG